MELRTGNREYNFCEFCHISLCNIVLMKLLNDFLMKKNETWMFLELNGNMEVRMLALQREEYKNLVLYLLLIRLQSMVTVPLLEVAVETCACPPK